MAVSTSMTVREALRFVARRLDGAVPAVLPEAEVILGHVVGCSRTQLYLRFMEISLADWQVGHLEEIVDRRRSLEPLQYLTGVQGFGTLNLQVGPGVLVPRPETELVVERALELLSGDPDPVVLDLGIGSGAIALAVAARRSDAEVWATELDEGAIDWARRNLELLNAGVKLLEGDLFAPLPEAMRMRFDLVISNPPYLSEAEFETLPHDVRDHEPKAALISGKTGLEVTARIVDEAAAWMKPRGWLVLETSPRLAPDVNKLVSARFHEVRIGFDLAGRPRMVEGRKP
jgi:release factor glutamine methyltransferase